MDNPQIDAAWVAHAKIALAAFCGGLVRLFLRPINGPTPAHAILKSIWLLFACVSCGFWGTPPIMDWFGLSDLYAGAVGAVLGLVGVSLAEGLLKAVDSVDIKGWILKLAGAKSAD